MIKSLRSFRTRGAFDLVFLPHVLQSPILSFLRLKPENWFSSFRFQGFDTFYILVIFKNYFKDLRLPPRRTPDDILLPFLAQNRFSPQPSYTWIQAQDPTRSRTRTYSGDSSSLGRIPKSGKHLFYNPELILR